MSTTGPSPVPSAPHDTGDARSENSLVCNRCGKLLTGGDDDNGDHFSSVVAPILVGVTIPTVTVILTTENWPGRPSANFRLAIAAAFIVASGFLVAAYQCSLGSVRALVPGAVRAALTYFGLLGLVAGLIMLTIPITSAASASGTTIVASAFLGLGAGVPIVLRIIEWLHHRKLRAAAKQ